MAVPKVFVSSTCYDLGEIREQLHNFIESFGFEAVLSENGDVFYHPYLHTHEACIKEVSNCELFILIIGGRFGGEYIVDKTKSITNAEYIAAKNNNIPIFALVKKSVYLNHHIYKENKNKEFVGDIGYPAIDKQEYALDIFQFIDEVRRASTNNALESFDSFQSIDSYLRKQWAGMFFDFLKTREVKTQIDATNHLVSEINNSSKNLEALVKSLYLSTSDNKSLAEKEIESIEINSLVEMFFDSVLFPSWQNSEYYPIDPLKFDVKKIAKISPKSLSWDKYLVKVGLFEYDNISNDEDELETYLQCVVNTYSNRYFLLNIKESIEHEKLFEKGVKNSTLKQREKVLNRILLKYSK